MSDGKIIEHPSTALNRKINEQRKEIDAMKVDIAVLRDLLHRTIKMLAIYEDAGSLKLPSGFVDKLKNPKKPEPDSDE
jgi:hypothetical protein